MLVAQPAQARLKRVVLLDAPIDVPQVCQQPDGLVVVRRAFRRDERIDLLPDASLMRGENESPNLRTCYPSA